jgi:endonuclease YncB( thermonuclease family)
LVLLWLCVAHARNVPSGDPLGGLASVIDGDTIKIAGTRIRLHGIDAPEAAQACNALGGGTWACGREATRALSHMLSGRSVECEGHARDRYGRVLARCSVEGVDVQAEMVRRGLAWAFVRYWTDYVLEEAETRAARRGIWQAETQTAWDYRATRWAQYDAAAPAGCAIRGNITRDGARIYHLPWGRDHTRVKMDLTRGKRWFCSEAEAEEAGWRRARCALLGRRMGARAG